MSVWTTLLDEARATHQAALAGFVPFPDAPAPQPITPTHIHAATLFEAEPLTNPLARAFQAASPQAQWRDTYAGTRIDPDFLDRFGCYCLIGPGGPYQARTMGAYVVTMPPHLDYPWHHHPAEEAYLILSGTAEFHRQGEPPETLHPGDISYHASNQPHATFTGDDFLVAYVVWRGDLSTRPVWTQKALR